MADFDPDAYLAAKPAAAFDPDVYLGKAAPKKNGFMQAVGNTAAGLVRGAGSLGATILAPRDALEGFIARQMGAPELAPQDRRTAMDGGLEQMGAQPDSLGFQGGKLAGEIAGTAGAGGVVANTLGRLAPGAATLTQAIRSGGLSAPGANIATRTAGGAISGAATAALVNPNDVVTGGLIGGALPGGVKLAGVTGNLLRQGAAGLTKNTLGLASGVGGEAVGTAYQAGKTGGTNFLDNMRGNVPYTDVLDDAKGALSKMRLERGAQYRQGMAEVSADKTVIDFTPIDKAVTSLKSMGNYKGKVINKNAAGAVDEITELVNDWKGLDPAEFHTPEGLDALKKAIGDIRDAAQIGSPARTAADAAYNAVKAEINTQAPTYAKVMKDYSEASDTLKEIERALSLGQKAAADTSMRKLQSLMRNNVNTNYGNRLDLAKTLESKGAEILPAIAGQQMSSLTPRGLQGLAATGAGAASLINPATLALLPMTSPRLIGEAAYGLGTMNRGLLKAVKTSAGKAGGLLTGPGGQPITMDQLRPLLSTAPILAAGQR